ncbi:hypothetical protein [Bacillus niameyensis]|nr:hypothetical protein [Bacillus niameyensis]
MATASNREITVVNCYGSTPELAKEIATMRLRVELNNVKADRYIKQH